METFTSEEEIPFIPLKDGTQRVPAASLKPITSFKIRAVYILLTTSVVLNLTLLLRRAGPVNSTASVCQYLYSPATEAIEYKPVKFTRGYVGDVPLYEQPPSAEVDAAWKALWLSPEIVSIPRSQAALLPNRTWPILGNEENYMTGLDMFHQLHCLDTLRMAIHPEDYPDLDYTINHLRHCVGHLRQAIMCFGDVTPVAMQWSSALSSAVRRDDIMHSCRVYSSLREWSLARHLEYDGKDLAVYIDDPLSA
ncbi:unnamed protein product [Peniophora sp. CBMAI 1063]|nr:unnamed protein product [Peniophora sp. CBMAI 1063]